MWVSKLVVVNTAARAIMFLTNITTIIVVIMTDVLVVVIQSHGGLCQGPPSDHPGGA